MGGADEMRNTADVLDKIGTGLVSTYAKRTGKTDQEITALLDAETWMTAQEAVDAGFAASVTAALAVKASYSEDRLPENVRLAFKAQAPTTDDFAPAGAPAPVFGETLASYAQTIADAAGLGYAWGADPALRNAEQVTAGAPNWHARCRRCASSPSARRWPTNLSRPRRRCRTCAPKFSLRWKRTTNT